jgi:hypothetical protein
MLKVVRMGIHFEHSFWKLLESAQNTWYEVEVRHNFVLDILNYMEYVFNFFYKICTVSFLDTSNSGCGGIFN